MSLPLPIVEQITQNLLTTLANVSTVNGEALTFNVLRSSPLGTPMDPTTLTVVLMEQNPLEDTGPQMWKQWTQPYTALILWFEREGSGFAPRVYLQVASAYAQKELRKDCQRGGLAINTTIKAPIWFDDASTYGAIDGIVVNFDVQYRHLLNDPFSQ